MSDQECVAPDLCGEGDSLCGGTRAACRIHDPCTCLDEGPDGVLDQRGCPVHDEP